MPTNEGFESQVTSLKLADIVQNDGAADLPPHLLELLQLREYDSIGDLRDDIASADEEEREAIWAKSDKCALMRALLPYEVAGRPSKVGRKVVGWLAHDMGVSGQTVRRYMNLGLHYPPDITDDDTGEVTVIRDPATPMNIYLTGLIGLEHGLTPVECVLKAIENQWSAGQLRKWIVEEQYRAHDETPPVKREWFKEVAQQPILADVLAVLDVAKMEVERQMARLIQAGAVPIHVRVSVMALEPAE